MRPLIVYLLLTFAATLPPAFAQQPSPDTALERGAGAYFAGRTDQAEQYLSTAIEYDSRDPRAYYLRGLNYVAMGDRQKAREDLTEGARLEAEMGSAPHIDRALAGVQGDARLILERARRTGRENVELQQRRSTAEARKREREKQEQRFLRTNYKLPIEALASKLTIEQARRVAASNAPADNASPFIDDNYNEDTTFADTANDDTAAAPSNPFDPAASAAAEAPEPSAASQEVGRSVGAFFRNWGQAMAEGNVGQMTGQLPPSPMAGGGGPAGGGSPFGEPAGGGGFGGGGMDDAAGAAGDFGGGDFGGGFDFDQNETTPPDQEQPQDAGNPFGEDPQSGDNPFDFGN